MAKPKYKPARPDPVASFSEHFGVDPDAMEELGVFDPIIERDSPFAISPRLLDGTTAPELTGAHDKVLEHFSKVMALLEHATPGDSLWKAAFRLFDFPEFAGASIGYSTQRGDGRGWPVNVRRATLKTGKEIVDAGIKNPRIFELVGLFQEGVGLDLVSDMIGTILRDLLIEYTQRVAKELGVPLLSFEGSPTPGLPLYLSERGEERCVILMPQDVLSDLPVAISYDDIGIVASANDETRTYLNKNIGKNWQSDMRKSMSKRNVREAIIHSKAFADSVIKRYQAKRVQQYNFKSDPRDAVRWLRRAKYEASQNPLQFSLTAVRTKDDAVTAVREVLEYFKKLVQTTRVKAALYNDNKTPRRETGVQDVFYAVAATQSIFNDLDVSAEVAIDNGKVDYKFSLGRSIRIVVEMKLARNGALVDGLRTQLPTYAKGEDAAFAFYLVVNNEGPGADKHVAELEADIEKNGVPKVTEVIVCDARRRAAPSKIRRPPNTSAHKRRPRHVRKKV